MMTCARCSDTGWLTFISGTYRTYGNSLNPGGLEVEATEEKPFYKRCPCKKSTPAEERVKETRVYE